jgi:leucyl-tRNA---protein transferase
VVLKKQPVRFFVVANDTEPCPYLPDATMRLPLRMPTARLPPDLFDQLLDQGDRRSGPLLYRPTCPACTACEAIRVHVPTFQPTRSQRRAARRNVDLTVDRARPSVSADHLRLYNRHSRERGLSLREQLATETDYRFFLVETSVDSWELRYLQEGRLLAVSILDFGQRAISSVYHYFDPDESWRSMGVFSVLREIELCRELGMEWYYLGLYVEACAHLNYKAEYYPHQRRIGGIWHHFEAPGSPGVPYVASGPSILI